MSESVGTKICQVCKIEKNLTDFFKRTYKSGLVGVHYQCKGCHKNYRKKLYSDPIKEQEKKEWFRQHYLNNKEKIDEHQREYYRKNKSKKNASTKKYYINNREKCRAFIKAHKIKHREHLSKLAYINHKRRIEADALYRLKSALRRRVSDFLKSKGLRKNESSLNLIGCEVDVVKKHLERQFKKGMTWDNHGTGEGKWQIDHVIPLASAKNEEDLVLLFHYKNLQPLWWKENIKKGAKIPRVQTKLPI